MKQQDMLLDQKQSALDSVKQQTQGEQVLEREAQVESYQEEGNKKFNLGIDTIYCYKLKIDNNKLLKNIDVFKKTGFKASAVNPWHSNTSLQLKSEFNFFVDELEKAFKYIGLDLILDNLWTTYQQQGEYTGIHNHTSGVLCWFFHTFGTPAAFCVRFVRRIDVFFGVEFLYAWSSATMDMASPNLLFGVSVYVTAFL